MAKKKQPKQIDPKIKRQRQVLFGGALLLLALLLILAFTSYLYSWKADYSTLTALTDRTVVAQNILNKLGALISHFFIYEGVGLGAFFIPYLIGLSGYKLFFQGSTSKLVTSWAWGLAHMLWTCLAFGYFWTDYPISSGVIGYELHSFAVIYIGRLGLLSILAFVFLCFIVIEFGWTPEKMAQWVKSLSKEKPEVTENMPDENLSVDFETNAETIEDDQEVISEESVDRLETQDAEESSLENEPISMEIETPVEESIEDQLSKKLD